jgi:ribose transport system permease protein
MTSRGGLLIAAGQSARRYGILFAFIILLALVTASDNGFLDSKNLFNMGQQWAPVGVMAIGMTLVLISGGFDLSVGGTYALSAVIVSSMTQHGHSALTSALLALVIGAAVGLVNGVLITKININPLVATLGSGQVVRGLALVYSNGGTYNINPGGFYDKLGSGYVGPVPIPLIVMIGIGVVLAIVLARSDYGRSLYAVGGNAEASYLSGIRVDGIRILAYVVAGMCASVAGAIYVGRVGSAQGSVGTGIELTVIAAVLIGGTSIAGGEGAMWRTGIGIAILAVLQNFFNANNVNAFWQSVVQGGIIIAAVGLDSYGKRSHGRSLRTSVTLLLQRRTDPRRSGAGLLDDLGPPRHITQ